MDTWLATFLLQLLIMLLWAFVGVFFVWRYVFISLNDIFRHEMAQSHGYSMFNNRGTDKLFSKVVAI